MFLIKPRHRRAARLFAQRLKSQLNPRRLTPLTLLVWAALVSDLAAPGYLVFHLGFTRLDVRSVAGTAAEVTTVTGAE